MTIKTAYNSTLAIGGVPSPLDSFVVAESSVLRINICANKPRHRKPPKRYQKPMAAVQTRNCVNSDELFFVRTLTTALLVSVCFLCNAQSDFIKTTIDNLRFVKDMPYICEIVWSKNIPSTKNTFIYDTGCGDKIFWDVVRLKDKAIPYLIAKLNDSTEVEASVPNTGGQYAVGDVAYVALEEIIKGIPTYELLAVKFDEHGCGECAYYNHLRKSIHNREKFKKAVSKWFDKNKLNLVWIVSNEFSTCDCSGKHPNGGHYEIKK